MSFSAQWGVLQWGAGRWAFPVSGSSTGAANIVGQALMTATINPIVVNGAAGIVGQGVETANGVVQGFGVASIVGQGVFLWPIVCPPDSIVYLYLVPRATVAVVMPIAYVTYVTNYSDAPQCLPSTKTVPVTGSLTTLVEGNDGEALTDV